MNTYACGWFLTRSIALPHRSLASVRWITSPVPKPALHEHHETLVFIDKDQLLHETSPEWEGYQRITHTPGSRLSLYSTSQPPALKAEIPRRAAFIAPLPTFFLHPLHPDVLAIKPIPESRCTRPHRRPAAVPARACRRGRSRPAPGRRRSAPGRRRGVVPAWKTFTSVIAAASSRPRMGKPFSIAAGIAPAGHDHAYGRPRVPLQAVGSEFVQPVLQRRLEQHPADPSSAASAAAASRGRRSGN